MKSKCVKLASFILALLFVFPMTVFADITTYADYVNNDMGCGVDYNLVNKTETLINYDEIYKYSLTTSSTYELDSMALYASDYNNLVSACSILDSNTSFQKTSPVGYNGNPLPPYSASLLLVTLFDIDNNKTVDKIGYNTAFLVSPDTAVTAAHCMYPSTGWEIMDAVCFPLVHDGERPTDGYINVSYYHLNNNFKTALNKNNISATFEHDWAVLKLEEDISDAYYFGCTYSTQSLVNKPTIATGYPHCEQISCGDSCSHQTAYLVSSWGKIIEMENNVLHITNNVREGMSGGPIYASATIQCHGIVSSHGTSEYNIGTPITQTVYNMISDYIEREK